MNPKLKRILRYIAIFMTIVWMIVIFRFFMDDGNSSHELSDSCVKLINHLIYQFTGKDLMMTIAPEHYSMIELFLRKCAHMSIYFVLAINIMIVLFTFNMKMILRMAIAVIASFGYALTDEFHQTFVAGRSGAFTDCLIDTSGAIFGVIAALILYCVLYTIMTKYQKKKGIVQSEYDQKIDLSNNKHIAK